MTPRFFKYFKTATKKDKTQRNVEADLEPNNITTAPPPVPEISFALHGNPTDTFRPGDTIEGCISMTPITAILPLALNITLYGRSRI